MDTYDLLVYTLKKPIHIILNKYFFKIKECPFWARGLMKGTWGGGENVLFIGYSLCL